jgi:hypothetical protein
MMLVPNYERYAFPSENLVYMSTYDPLEPLSRTDRP